MTLHFKSEAEFKRWQERVKADGGKLRIVGGRDVLAAVAAPAVVAPAPAKPIEASTPPLRKPLRANKRRPRINARQRRHCRLLAKLTALALLCAFPYGPYLLFIWLWLRR